MKAQCHYFSSNTDALPQAVLYFDEITRAEECVALPLRDVMTVEEAKDALVTVYDYYNREETASLLYNMDQ